MRRAFMGAAMKLTGHKTESIYRRYAIVSEADLRGRAEAGGHAGRWGSGALSDCCRVCLPRETLSPSRT